VQLGPKDRKLRGAILIYLMGRYRVTELRKNLPSLARLATMYITSRNVNIRIEDLFSQLSLLLSLSLLLLERKHRRESPETHEETIPCVVLVRESPIGLRRHRRTLLTINADTIVCIIDNDSV